MPLFCLKSVPWTGNELADDDIENCANSQLKLQISYISCSFVSVRVEILLKLCLIAVYNYLQQALPRVVIYRTPVVKRKWKLRVRFSATKENRVHHTKILTKNDEDSFVACGVQVKIRTKKSLF